MINMDKTYTTRDGREVIIHEVKMHNSAGEIVSFPVKGTIIEVLPSGRRRRTFSIWSLEGRARPLHEHDSDIVDLIPTTPEDQIVCTLEQTDEETLEITLAEFIEANSDDNGYPMDDEIQKAIVAARAGRIYEGSAGMGSIWKLSPKGGA
jgi:hypothetical protein